MSHPMWVRGLKQPQGVATGGQAVSHPMWVRGLKPRMEEGNKQFFHVAPHVGAWIETNS